LVTAVVGFGCTARESQQTGSQPGSGGDAPAASSPAPAQGPPVVTVAAAPQQHTVVRATDGDSLVLENGDRVRLIGVDTPETVHPLLPVQRFGKEAKAFSTKMAEGKDVTLEFGPELRDKYGRLLAYVWIGDLLLNRMLIKRGYGFAMTRFSHGKMADFLEAEQEARDRRYGMWHDSPSDGRMTGLMERWDALSPEGKHLLDQYWNKLLAAHPAESKPR